jgi:hypothetical protein
VSTGHGSSLMGKIDREKRHCSKKKKVLHAAGSNFSRAQSRLGIINLLGLLFAIARMRVGISIEILLM